MSELEQELKEFIIRTLALEEYTPEDIDSEEPLFGHGVGLDSVDALELGMAALVEVHDDQELERARALGARIVGINNRDLSTFRTDLAVSERLQAELPDDVVTVSESGIRTGDEVARLGRAGLHAILVGETLLRAEDPGLELDKLTAHERTDR